MKKNFEDIVSDCLRGIPADIDNLIEIEGTLTTEQLCEAADKVRLHNNGKKIDTCSIVNARSGRCSEDCKWCAQSRFHNTGVETYDIVSDEDLERAVAINGAKSVHRFSLVTSGRKIGPGDIHRFCDLYRKARHKDGAVLFCASMGLLSSDELKSLREVGVTRYHCNLETSASYFPTLCTTHSQEDKLRTIKAAREAGMEICCGGIIGMGESLRQRLELAAEAREAGAVSIPVNILNPIKGTRLEAQPLIGEEEIVRSVALMKLVAPMCTLRFAGGRMRLNQESNRRMLCGGVGGAIVGDLLTTIGNSLDEDLRLFKEVEDRETE